MKTKTTFRYIKLNNVLMTYKIKVAGNKITFGNIALSNMTGLKRTDRTRKFNPELIKLFKTISSFYNIKPQALFRAAVNGDALIRIDESVSKNDQAYRAIADRLKANFTQSKGLVLWAKKTKEDFKEFRTVFNLKSGQVASILACEDMLLALEPLVSKTVNLRLRYTTEDRKDILNAFDKILQIEPKPNKPKAVSKIEYRARIFLTDAEYLKWTMKSQHLHQNKLYVLPDYNIAKRHNMNAALVQMVHEIPIRVGGFGVRAITLIKLKDIADNFNIAVANANKCKKEAIPFKITDLYKSLNELRRALQQLIDDKEI